MTRLEIKEVQKVLLDLMKEVHNFLAEHGLKYYLLGGSALGAVRHNGFIPWDDDIDIGLLREDYEKFLDLREKFNAKYEIINFQNAGNCDFGLTRIYIPNTFIDNPVVSKTKLDTRLYFDVFPLDNVPDDKAELAKYEQKILKKKRLIQRIDLRNYGNSKLEIMIKKALSTCLVPFRSCILKSFDNLIKKYRYDETVCVCSLCSQYSFKKQVMNRSVYGEPVLHIFEDVELYIPENIHAYLTTLFGDDYMSLPPEGKRRPGFDIYLLDEDSNVSNID